MIRTPLKSLAVATAMMLGSAAAAEWTAETDAGGVSELRFVGTGLFRSEGVSETPEAAVILVMRCAVVPSGGQQVGAVQYYLLIPAAMSALVDENRAVIDAGVAFMAVLADGAGIDAATGLVPLGELARDDSSVMLGSQIQPSVEANDDLMTGSLMLFSAAVPESVAAIAGAARTVDVHVNLGGAVFWIELAATGAAAAARGFREGCSGTDVYLPVEP